jgi:hypothetical protein
MSESAAPPKCIECNQDIGPNEKYLVVSSGDGKQQYVHTTCFTATTFDPDRFQNVTDPESGRQLR